MFAVGLIPALLLFVAMFFLAESPRWLVKHGYDDNAKSIPAKIRGTTQVGYEVSCIKNTLSETKPDWQELIGPAMRPALVLC